MLTNTLISKILLMTPQGVGKWRKENRPIIELLEKYFSRNDLEEFLEKKTVSKYDFFALVEPELIHKYTSLQFDFIQNPYNEKLYLDFLSRYKKEIIQLERLSAKDDFLVLLFDYHATLVKIAEEINYSTLFISKEFHEFYTIFSTKEHEFFILLSTLVKNDFIFYNTFFEDGKIEKKYEKLKRVISPYENKELLNIPLEQIKKINDIDTSKFDIQLNASVEPEKKDFFEVYEEYLLEQEIPF
ncbi:hypothetical protein CRV01_06180 [Arcobacter sp. CECT 8983]|uniref:hypothetical protein n=1 Tax=Arcobacter sp. CECT 8983 TaxID=2044508 RepID=UPI00100A5B04|nr:hypothetical protein [Arcobacter sp. CECT 8983]RXJ90734.1 hypothetical protein CRV01_06180 [Arcobacter sp. CECT 8983]